MAQIWNTYEDAQIAAETICTTMRETGGLPAILVDAYKDSMQKANKSGVVMRFYQLVAHNCPKALKYFSAEEDIARLISALGSYEVRDYEPAINELIKYGSDAVPALIRAAKDKSEKSAVREWAVYILGRIGDERAVGPLIDLMNELGDYHILTRVSTALNMIIDSMALREDKSAYHRVVEMAAPALAKSLDDKTREYRRLTDTTHGPPASATEVAANERYRQNVIEVFKEIGDVDAIVDAIGRLFNKPRLEGAGVLSAAVEALGDIGTNQRASPNKETAIDILKGAVDNPEVYEETRREAEKALIQINVNQ